MSANRLYLVCSHHPNPEDALCLAERAGNDVPYLATNLKRADDWFTKHAECGRGRDHFALAHARPIDWDVAPPAENTAAGAVRLALVNGSH